MKSLYGLGLSALLFAGWVGAAPDPLSQLDVDQTAVITPAAVTAPSPSSEMYVFNVREQGGHEGRLTFGDQEVTFEANHEKHSMSWNYNMFKKLKVNSAHNVMYLVMHGGESIRFRILGGETPSDVLTHVVATRIAKAPRYRPAV